MGTEVPCAISDLRLITDQPHPISPLDRFAQSAAGGQDPEEAMEPEANVPTEEAEEQGEVRDVRIPKSPDDPTRAQVEEHRARAHLPYRSWCGHCVNGRKKNPPHYRTAESAGREVPQVCLDYAFLRDQGRGGHDHLPGLQGHGTKGSLC
jgi:hypothetical protein